MVRTGNSAGLLREFLAEADLPCPGCGYNLRGLQASACPECNQALVLQVALAEPRLGPLIAALLGLAVGAGSAGTWLILFLAAGLIQGFTPPFIPILIMMLGLVGEGVPLALLARRTGRAWFRRHGPATAVRIATGAWVATAVWVALLLAAMLLID
jgi:hypothetical protein